MIEPAHKTYKIGGSSASEIASSIERIIRDGRLLAGEVLPPIRELALSLKVTPGTIAAAYRALQSRGIVNAGRRRGTRVSARPPLLARATEDVPSGLRNLAAGNPDTALLPDQREYLRRLKVRPRLYGEPHNRRGLLEIAVRQFEADGVPARSLAIMGGALDAIERTLQAHLQMGDCVAVEDPGYFEIFDLISALGLKIIPVQIDKYGMESDDLENALKRGAAACIITPRAQNPTGGSLDNTRARDLRRLLDAHGEVLVIEDDHAGPIAGAPHHTVCHPRKERWAVVRSVSKSLGPDLRIALVAGDEATISRVEGRQAVGAGW
ncbi:MAG: aminotransferase class I/II-fold pyridoxal phosphate-dependent enzyme, partial [Deltaproteobacteria bacterium]|nr:aminotransferase class I/II-fold pyridoxal phosphate-dependent enzyme [Deltaproteobacteria bacterium]